MNTPASAQSPASAQCASTAAEATPKRPYLRRPPLVSGDPLLGSVRPMLSNPLAFLQQAYLHYGDVFRFKVPGKEFTVLGGINANRFVAGEGRHCFSVDGFWGEAGRHMQCPHMVTMVDGEMHRYQRSLMGPALAQQAFKDSIPHMADNVERLLHKRAQGTPLVVGGLMRQLLSNQLSDLLLGRKASYRNVEAMIYYFSAVTKVFALGSWPRFMLKSPKVKWAQWVTSLELQDTLQQARIRMAAAPDQGLYLDRVLPALDARPDWFADGDKLAHVLLPYVAATKGFMLYQLLRDPALYHRVRQEVDACFAKGIPDLQGLRALNTLNGFYRETMRLYPAAFGIPRTAAQDFDYQGYSIKQGDKVLVFTTADHLNPEYFPNPSVFDVERYQSPRDEHRQAAYAPFGKGPHNCLGASLSELILPLHMGLLLYLTEVEPACDLDKVSMTFNPAPVLSKNFKVRLRWRRP